MAIANLYIMEAANLFMGDHDPEASNHLVLDELKLPDLESTRISLNPGGSIMALNLATSQVMPLEATFKLKGMDPERLIAFGLGSIDRRKFTAYGSIREKRTNKAVDAVAVIEGVITKLSGSAFSRGAGMDHDYQIGEVISYSLKMDNKAIFDYDFFTTRNEVGGVDQAAELRRHLRIPGGA